MGTKVLLHGLRGRERIGLGLGLKMVMVGVRVVGRRVNGLVRLEAIRRGIREHDIVSLILARFEAVM